MDERWKHVSVSRRRQVAAVCLVLLSTLDSGGPLLAREGSDRNKDRIRALLKSRESQSSGRNPSLLVEKQVAQDTFFVNASYIGGVKKTFRRIGFGKIHYADLGDGNFRLRAKAEIRHPESEETYKFQLNMRFGVKDRNIHLLSNESEFNQASKDYRSRVEQAAPFIFLSKSLAVPSSGEELSREFSYEGKRFAIRYHRQGDLVEASVFQGSDLLSKAFINRGREGPFNRFEKLRIPEKDLIISFIVRPEGAAGFDPPQYESRY